MLYYDLKQLIVVNLVYVIIFVFLDEYICNNIFLPVRLECFSICLKDMLEYFAIFTDEKTLCVSYFRSFLISDLRKFE